VIDGVKLARSVECMARKLRLEFPGACYHVINRGNYRADVFATEGARAAFEKCLFAACAKSGWVLHAFVIMRNHYHLALETPTGNLSVGMQWLQATFANRFNRRRGERGHLFQGRYKALLVEAGGPLGQVCHYLHLNPVRAGVVPVARLAEFRYSSYWYLRRPAARPGFLQPATALAEAGGLADTPAGRRGYADYLAWQAAEGPAGKSQAYVNLSRGWALGTAGFKAAMVHDHALAAEARAWEGGGAREIRELRWAAELERCLLALGKTGADVHSERKSAPWKAAIALRLKEATQASNRWLGERLHMGRPEAVSVHVGRLRRSGVERNSDYTKLSANV
jgi:REP element-mobilizing transposase RayT